MKKLFICLYLILTSSVGYSEVNCVQTPYGTECSAHIPKKLATKATVETGVQYFNQWCWAASIENVFKHWGFEIGQDRIVQETFGGIYNFSAHPWTIMSQLNRHWFDDDGRSFRSIASSITNSEAAVELANNKPVIIGYQHSQGGHAVVLESINYLPNAYGSQIVGAWVSDPGFGNLRELYPNEFNNITFRAKVDLVETPTSSDIIFNKFEQQYSNYFPPKTSNTQTTQYTEGNLYYRWYANGRGLYAYQGEIHYNLGNGWQYFSTLQEANQYLCNNGCF